MATVIEKKDKDGNVRAYKAVATLGRDERNRKVYASKTFKRPEGLTPKKEEKEVARIIEEWEHEQRELYAQSSKAAIDERAKRKKVLFSDFMDIWVEKHVKNGAHTPNTVSFYAHMSDDIKKYFKEREPNLRLADFGKSDVLDYLAYLRNEAKTKNGKSYSAATIKHHYDTLRNILEYAVYIEWLNSDPCKKLKLSDKPRREDGEIDFLEEEDAVRFMAALDSDEEVEYWKKHQGTHLQWKTLINIMIVTGLRRGEIVGLRWGDLDKKNRLLKIRRNVTIDKEAQDKIHVGETKGKRIRKVPISQYVLGLLEQLREERRESYGEEPSKDTYIFCRANDTSLPMYPTEPTRMVSKYIKRHGLPNVSPHDLRHTAASLAIQSGANIKEIQAVLGHKDAATTLKFYAGISEKAQRETVDGIEGILRKDTKE